MGGVGVGDGAGVTDVAGSDGGGGAGTVVKVHPPSDMDGEMWVNLHFDPQVQ